MIMSTRNDYSRESREATCLPSSPSSALSRVDIIDSALQAAMRDVRERVALLRLETVLCEFVTINQAVWIEVGGSYNAVIVSLDTQSLNRSSPQQLQNQSSFGRSRSFQRCLVHRLADRFNIAREAGVLLEGSIRLIKTTGSCIPPRLLQDMDPSEYTEMYNDTTYAATGLTTAFANQTLVDSQPQQAQIQQPMKIMKRCSTKKGVQDMSSREGSGQSQQQFTVLDKEKAYAAARARIFCNDNSDSLVDDLSSSTPTCALEKTTSTADPDNTSLFSRTRLNDSMNSTSVVTSLTSSSNNNNIMESKAVYRNRAEEAADPDFQRGTGGTVLFSPSSPPPTSLSSSTLPQLQQSHSHAQRATTTTAATSQNYFADPVYATQSFNVATASTKTNGTTGYPLAPHLSSTSSAHSYMKPSMTLLSSSSSMPIPSSPLAESTLMATAPAFVPRMSAGATTVESRRVRSTTAIANPNLMHSTSSNSKNGNQRQQRLFSSDPGSVQMFHSHGRTNG